MAYELVNEYSIAIDVNFCTLMKCLKRNEDHHNSVAEQIPDSSVAPDLVPPTDTQPSHLHHQYHSDLGGLGDLLTGLQHMYPNDLQVMFFCFVLLCVCGFAFPFCFSY